LLIVDEAFCDLNPEQSVAYQAGMRGLLVLKSFGKFFGLAGVRLGFAAGHTEDIAVLSKHLGPWAVSGPALVIGAACLNDFQLRNEISGSIIENEEAQRAMLENLGFEVVAETSLFHLVIHRYAKTLHERLAHQHILTRIFSDQPNWLRLGLCKDDMERERLRSALSAALSTL
jgi:cobalamin biosynthesis protein CobC